MSWNNPFPAFIRSFGYALQGLAHCIRRERNMRVHLSAAVIVLAFSACYGLERAQYGLLILTIGLVMAAEAFNTAVERAVDLTTTERRKLAKEAKDCAAAGVLLAAAAAVGVGFALFGDWPRLWAALQGIIASPMKLAGFVALALFGIYFSFFWQASR